MKTNVFFEIGSTKINSSYLIDAVKEIWKSEGKLIKDIKVLELYYKAEEGKCYYVVNDGEKGFFDVLI